MLPSDPDATAMSDVEDTDSAPARCARQAAAVGRELTCTARGAAARGRGLVGAAGVTWRSSHPKTSRSTGSAAAESCAYGRAHSSLGLLVEDALAEQAAEGGTALRSRAPPRRCAAVETLSLAPTVGC